MRSRHPADPSHAATTRDAYDGLAERYQALARGALATLPLDRAFLAAFAELAGAHPAGRVLEVGCGPGETTAHLRDLGLRDVAGLDLAPRMIELARAAHPDLSFEVGTMRALPYADAALAGLVSWYSVIHLPPEELPAHLAEFARVLTPGGHLLLAFFEGESPGDPVTPFDHAVTTAYRWPLEKLAGLARDAGFAEVGRLLREPVADERRFRRGHLLLRHDG